MGVLRESRPARPRVAIRLAARLAARHDRPHRECRSVLARGYTPLHAARLQTGFRRFGMPFSFEPKARVSATARACRAMVAARPERSRGASGRPCARSSCAVLDVADARRRRARQRRRRGGDRLPGRDDPRGARQPRGDRGLRAHREEARSAAGTAAERQGKTAKTDEGIVRYTAPSVIFERNGDALVAGGFQPIEAYDMLVSNLVPGIERRPGSDRCRRRDRSLPARTDDPGGRRGLTRATTEGSRRCRARPARPGRRGTRRAGRTR